MHIANKNTDKTVREFICEEQSNIAKYQPETFALAFLNPLKRHLEITNILKSVARRGFTGTHTILHPPTHTRSIHISVESEVMQGRTNYDILLLSGPFPP